MSNPQMIGHAEPAGAKDRADPQPAAQPAQQPAAQDARPEPRLDPSRYGDWERNGRCIDF